MVAVIALCKTLEGTELTITNHIGLSPPLFTRILERRNPYWTTRSSHMRSLKSLHYYICSLTYQTLALLFI